MSDFSKTQEVLFCLDLRDSGYKVHLHKKFTGAEWVWWPIPAIPVLKG